MLGVLEAPLATEGEGEREPQFVGGALWVRDSVLEGKGVLLGVGERVFPAKTRVPPLPSSTQPPAVAVGAPGEGVPLAAGAIERVGWKEAVRREVVGVDVGAMAECVGALAVAEGEEVAEGQGESVCGREEEERTRDSEGRRVGEGDVLLPTAGLALLPPGPLAVGKMGEEGVGRGLEGEEEGVEAPSG